MILLHFPLFETAFIAFISCLISTFLIFGAKRMYRRMKALFKKSEREPVKGSIESRL